MTDKKVSPKAIAHDNHLLTAHSLLNPLAKPKNFIPSTLGKTLPKAKTSLIKLKETSIEQLSLYTPITASAKRLHAKIAGSSQPFPGDT